MLWEIEHKINMLYEWLGTYVGLHISMQVIFSHKILKLSEHFCWMKATSLYNIIFAPVAVIICNATRLK